MFQEKAMQELKKKIKDKKIVVLAEHLQQQTDCSRYKVKISKSRRISPWRNMLYLSFFLGKGTKPRIYK